MSSRTLTISALLAVVAVTLSQGARAASAATRHGGLFSGNGMPGISVQLGRQSGTSHSLGTIHSTLTLPAPAATNAAPATKAQHLPAAIPNFANPLHRHRMAMPNLVIPALGDLAF